MIALREEEHGCGDDFEEDDDSCCWGGDELARAYTLTHVHTHFTSLSLLLAV